mmetsp:Transcript_31221/g.70703  ORF Transcript_31221/g.70703 Transcript_31221/m.70703 type:complete len:434 (+) Transcript_31221:1091-2392(+)
MDRGAVLVVHLVKLVDEADAVVGEHHRAALQAPLAALVLRHRSRETHGTRALPGGVDGPGEGLLHVLEELRLGQARVAHDQDVDVAADAVLPGALLPAAAHHRHGDGRLNVTHPEDGRRDGGDDALADVRALGQLEDLLCLLVSDLEYLGVSLAVHVHGLDLRAEHGEAGASVRSRIVQAAIDARHLEVVAGSDGVHLVASQDHVLRAGHLPRLDAAGALLQRDLLEVAVQRLRTVDDPGPSRLTLEASPWLQVLLLGDVERTAGEAALGAAQVKTLDLIEHVAALRRDTVDEHQLVQVLRVQLTDRLAHGERVDCHPQLILVGVAQLLVRLELTLRLAHEGLVQDRQDAQRVVGDPQRERRAPLLQVQEAHVQVPLVLLGHLLQHVRVLRLRLALGRELQEELAEIAADLLLQPLVDGLGALGQALVRQVVV